MSVHRRGIGWVGMAVLACGLVGCGGQKTEAPPPAPAPKEEPAPTVGPVDQAVVELEPRSGSQVTGQGAFTIEGDKVTLFLSLQNLPPGVHAVHVHEKGDCSAPDASSAGPHWNPMGHDHGKWNEMPFHLGDLGNVQADAGGNGSLTLTTSLWTLGGGGEDDVLGKSIVVHEQQDDFKTQPTGNAGGRIACGVIGAR